MLDGDSFLLAVHRKWAVGVGVVVLVVALVGLWLGSGLEGTGFLPVLAIAIAVIGVQESPSGSSSNERNIVGT